MSEEIVNCSCGTDEKFIDQRVLSIKELVEKRKSNRDANILVKCQLSSLGGYLDDNKAQIKAVFEDVFQVIKNLTGIRYVFMNRSSDSDIMLQITGHGFEGRRSFHAQVSWIGFNPFMTIYSLEINKYRNWNFRGKDSLTLDDELDFYSVALHELGHLIGLHHSNNDNDVMYKSIGYGQFNVRREFTDNEVALIKRLWKRP